jgi:hypothetical protein
MSEHDQETAVNVPGNAVSTKQPVGLGDVWSGTGEMLSGPKVLWFSLPPISVSVTRPAGFWNI